MIALLTYMLCTNTMQQQSLEAWRAKADEKRQHEDVLDPIRREKQAKEMHELRARFIHAQVKKQEQQQKSKVQCALFARLSDVENIGCESAAYASGAQSTSAHME